MNKLATIADIDELKRDYRDLIAISKEQANAKIETIESILLQKLERIDRKMDKQIENILTLYSEVYNLKDKVKTNTWRIE
jgi:hypothetical protein